MARSIYICYFGVREPLVRTQVFPYLRELRRAGHEITLLTFEPEDLVDLEHDLRKEFEGYGIDWHWLRYHKRPSVPATLYDLANGVRYVAKLSRKQKFDILHVRGHIPAPIGAVIKRMFGGKLLFDIRGFLPEEYLDAGVWTETGAVYRSFKRVERQLMKEADGFIVLTEAARQILFPESAETGFDRFGRPVEVIPCCLDFRRMVDDPLSRDKFREANGWTDRFVVTHVGSLGGLYLTDKIVELMGAAKRRFPSAFALILTQRNADGLAEQLEAAGFDRDSYLIKSVAPEEILSYLIGADLSISIVKSSYSSASRSPTKIAEYLAAGLPLISSPGVGDTDQLVTDENVGITLNGLETEDFDQAIADVTALTNNPATRGRLLRVARERFDLESVGGPRYRRMYERLMSTTNSRSLYICYFGVREPLVQTQVVPYLRELAAAGHSMTLLTFEPEPPSDWEDSTRQALAADGIEWHWLRYHKSPSVPATIFDLVNGTRYVRRLARKNRFDIFHVRGHVPAPIGAVAKRLYGGKLLFDIRGFLPEEYVDAGVWKKTGVVYRASKLVESWIVKKADGFVVLTEKARTILFPESSETGYDKEGRPVEVIPCCVDLSKFPKSHDLKRSALRQELGIGDRYVAVYVGSFGGWYLAGEMLDFFETLRREIPNCFVLILTQRDQASIEEEFLQRGFSPSDFIVMGVSPSEVSAYLSVADVSLSFINPSYSKTSSSPTKIAEYLAAGIPVVCNQGIGDVDTVITSFGVGSLVKEFTFEAYREALDEVNQFGNIAERCREVASTEFDLSTVGGPRYRRLYSRILDVSKSRKGTRM